MDPTPDPLITELHHALRAVLAHVAPLPGVHGVPVHDGPTGAAAEALAELDAYAYEQSVADGGLELGLAAGVAVAEELGRAACGNPYRAAALLADLGAGAAEAYPGKASPAAAGFEALPTGDALVARPFDDHRGDGWELTGAVTIDNPDPDQFLVAVRIGGKPMLVAVPADAPGCTVHPELWPPVASFESTPVTPGQVLGALDDSPTGALTRARLRQAAYLLGIADGAHDAATRYAATRRQFDTRLAEMQAVSLPLARAAVTLRSVRAAVRRAAWLVDTALPDANSAAAQSTTALPNANSTATQPTTTLPDAYSAATQSSTAPPDVDSTATQSSTALPNANSATAQSSTTLPNANSATAQPTTTLPDTNSAATHSSTALPSAHSATAQWSEAASAAVEALALAAEAADEVVRISMQACGVRAMTPELSLHRYFRLAAAESRRYGEPAALWRLAGAARVTRARQASAARRQLTNAQPIGEPVAL